MNFSIRMTENERKLTESYAKIHGMSVGEAIKKVFFDTVEEEFDIVLAKRALNEYMKDPKTFALEEVRKELKL